MSAARSASPIVVVPPASALSVANADAPPALLQAPEDRDRLAVLCSQLAGDASLVLADGLTVCAESPAAVAGGRP